MTRRRILTLLSLIIIIFISIYCSVPKRGSGMDKDEIIKFSDNIFLAKLIRTDTIHKRKRLINYLVPVKHLKGNHNDTVKFTTQRYTNDTIDFNNHSDSVFWNKNIGRSKWSCCICGPNFTFSKEYTYLLFPDNFGAYKSAEIINDTIKDKWYNYVKDNLAKNKK